MIIIDICLSNNYNETEHLKIEENDDRIRMLDYLSDDIVNVEISNEIR